MANSKLFSRRSPVKKVRTDTVNLAGNAAYSMQAKEALSTLAVTGTFNNTFYANAVDQLNEVKTLLGQVEPEFAAKVAIYARQSGFMKDMPAFIVAYLMSTDIDSPTLQRIFNSVITNGKMLKNFVQIMRSGQINGRKSMGTRPKRFVQNWLNSRPIDRLIQDNIGNDPSLTDVVKMVHPCPIDTEHSEFYKYLLSGQIGDSLPKRLWDYKAWKEGERSTVPDMPFLQLTSETLTVKDWERIVPTMSWTALRMNLNTLQRNGYFHNDKNIKSVAQRISDPTEVRKSKCFPYQLMTAYQHGDDLPGPIKLALQDALEIATENVPEFVGSIGCIIDTSGSMQSPVTGNRGSASTKVMCTHVAGLIGSTLLRNNPTTTMIGFATTGFPLDLNPRDSVMTNAQVIAKKGGGGTNLTAGMELLFSKNKSPDLVIVVSDNQSWMDTGQLGGQTAARGVWGKIKKNNPNARLVCIDLQPYTTTQIPSDKSVMNIGGFSDQVWEVIAEFCQNQGGFVRKIEEITI